MARPPIWLRGLTIIASALAFAACMSMESPPKVFGSGPAVMGPGQLKVLGPAPVKGTFIPVALEPLTGAPAEELFAMEDALKAVAPSRQLNLVAATDKTAIYRLKGYLSAVGDSQSVLVVYVWDVTDASGNRLHRISGQERAAGSSTDPWANVTLREINEAARETIDARAAWLKT
ncbi:hypothetical protein BH10PSE9_BH10PSE9_05890 [soil metagenome]